MQNQPYEEVQIQEPRILSYHEAHEEVSKLMYSELRILKYIFKCCITKNSLDPGYINKKDLASYANLVDSTRGQKITKMIRKGLIVRLTEYNNIPFPYRFDYIHIGLPKVVYEVAMELKIHESEGEHLAYIKPEQFAPIIQKCENKVVMSPQPDNQNLEYQQDRELVEEREGRKEYDTKEDQKIIVEAVREKSEKERKAFDAWRKSLMPEELKKKFEEVYERELKKLHEMIIEYPLFNSYLCEKLLATEERLRRAEKKLVSYENVHQKGN